jgi:hypothetical protein
MDIQKHTGRLKDIQGHTRTHIRSQAVYIESRWISTRITSPDGRELKLQYVYEPPDHT